MIMMLGSNKFIITSFFLDLMNEAKMKNENGDLFCHSFVVGEWTRRVILRRKLPRGRKKRVSRSLIRCLLCAMQPAFCLSSSARFLPCFLKLGNDTSLENFEISIRQVPCLSADLDERGLRTLFQMRKLPRGLLQKVVVMIRLPLGGSLDDGGLTTMADG